MEAMLSARSGGKLSARSTAPKTGPFGSSSSVAPSFSSSNTAHSSVSSAKAAKMKKQIESVSSARSDLSVLSNPWDDAGMTHQQFLDTQPMPKLVMKTLKQLDFFMKKYGYKTADLFRRRDLNLSLQQGGNDQLLNVEELVQIVSRITSDIYPGDIRRVVHYLDANDNGELDYEELDSALRRARRDMLKLDGMGQIASLTLTDPNKAKEVMCMTTRSAMKAAGYRGRRKKPRD